MLEELFGALGQTGALSGGETFRSEVLHTVVETSVHERGVKSHEIGHLLLLDDLLEGLLFLVVELVHFVSP